MDGAILGSANRDPLEGRILAGRYAIETCVGEGAMGRVYRARHRRLGRSFALKVLFGEVAADAAMRRRFEREAEVASRLDHPHVVPTLDFGEIEGGLVFLVMPYVAGSDLAAIIRREGALAPRRAVRLARQIAAGLGHAHERGVIHRDLKPTNILIEPTSTGEHARILDFGLALGRGDAARTRLTTAGIVMGTPLYMAPEQASGQTLDARADLFGLGVTLYEMLAGLPPFEGAPAEVARQYAASDIPPIAARVPGALVPPAAESIARRLLAKRPEQRFESAQAVIDALGAIRGDALRAQSHPLPVAAAPGDQDGVITMRLGAPRSQRRRAPWAISGAGAAAALAAAFFVAHLTQGAATVEDASSGGPEIAEPLAAEDPLPERTTASSDASLDELVRRHRELLRSLDELDELEGRGDREAVQSLRERLLSMPLEALREPRALSSALAALSELADEIEGLREEDPDQSMTPGSRH